MKPGYHSDKLRTRCGPEDSTLRGEGSRRGMIRVEMVVALYKQVTPEPQFYHLQNGNNPRPTPGLPQGPEVTHGPLLEADVADGGGCSGGACDEAVGTVGRHPRGPGGRQVPWRPAGAPCSLARVHQHLLAFFGRIVEAGLAESHTAALGFHVSCHSINMTGDISGL